MEDKRSDLQYQAMKKWLETRKGTVVLPTGAGKTFVAITIALEQLKRNRISSVLVIVPTKVLLEQ